MTAQFAVHRLEQAVRVVDVRLNARSGNWPPLVVEISPADAVDPDCGWALARIERDGGNVNVAVSVSLTASVEDYVSERDR
jgi:hypothetical protein